MAIQGKNSKEYHDKLTARLEGIVPPAEIRYKAELAWEIEQLKKEKNAVVLGHNYMEPALFHSVCDIKGDSLELARRAAEVKSERLVFCGVRFMAETAKLLNPERKVLIPSPEAGCSLASSITAEDVRRLKAENPGLPVVTYINTYADVKAESDICCTSSNAPAVVESLGVDRFIFIPDEYLAGNIARDMNREIVTLNSTRYKAPSENGKKRIQGVQLPVLGWNGRCEVHEQFTVEDIENVRRQFPDVFVLAHPECSTEVVEASDFSGSTSAMIKEVKQSDKPRYLLMTECSMADNIAAEVPDKEMVRLCSVRCPHMNEITLELVREALLHDRYEVDVEESIVEPARASIERMLAI